MKLAFIMSEIVKFLRKLQKVDLPPQEAEDREYLLRKILNMGDELVDELAKEGHCKVYLDCGEHEYAWNCRIKRGEPCPYNHLKEHKVKASDEHKT